LKDEVITTGVDDLLALLKQVDKIPLIDAAMQLKITPPLLQSWVDFLVEEEIIGIEYKFTKPIIYLNKPPEKKESFISEDADMNLEAYKNDFKSRAAEKNIPHDKISFFWKNHVKESLNRKREFFYREAKKRNLSNVPALWQGYNERLLSS